MMTKCIQWLLGVGLVVGFMLVGQVAYWEFWPMEVAEFTSPGRILNTGKVVEAGHVLQYEVKGCFFRNVNNVAVQRALVDSFVYNLPVLNTKPRIGCIQEVRTLMIPKTFFSGKFHVTVDMVFQVNPLRTVDVHMQTEDFTIVESEE